jgi:hypothetical protein
VARIARNRRQVKAPIFFPPESVDHAEHGGDEAAIAIEHDDRLDAISVLRAKPEN